MSIVTTDNRFYSEIAAAIREKNGESTGYLPADMAEAILAIKGGGDAYAAISVTYPEGSICTCSQAGQTTITAGDTSGIWLFVVPTGGTWTITSTDGAHTKSNSAAITMHGQIESVTISYALEIYDPVSRQFIDSMKRVLGSGGTANYITTYENYFNYNVDFAALFTANKYDVGDYTKLCFDFADSGKASGQTFVLGLSDQNSQVGSSYYSYKIVSNFSNPTSRNTAIVDISAADHSKTYYIGFTKYNPSPSQSLVSCYRWWLE